MTSASLLTLNTATKSCECIALKAAASDDPEVSSMSNGIGKKNSERTITDDLVAELQRASTSGVRKWLPRWLRVAFADPIVEDLYQSYYHQQKQRDMDFFSLTCLLIGCCMLVLHLSRTSENLVLEAVVIACSTLMHGLSLMACKLDWVPQSVWPFVPYVGWTLVTVQLLSDALLSPSNAPEPGGDFLVWVLVVVYITYALLPLRLRFCTLLAISTSTMQLVLTAIVQGYYAHSVAHEFAATLLLLAGANVLGVMSHIFADMKQRTSFLETRQSLEVKLVIEEQSQEQERLLLSVLPQHVAVEIRQDLGAVVAGQFKKIYMSRHENVSILFADIVGFTAISSTYSAADLVQILNELFARFDKLAEKFHQLRIKILGDCYYCVSGAPVERSDHAVLCVHMGLSMVEAIKYVREKTKSPVDMRVGIHTGGVLAGILGQRQWQFDVYSKDVELANKMESSGLPGRVHLSEKTLNYLNGEFEVEHGDGASREESIKSAALKTYFIVRVLKPYPEGTMDVREIRSDKDLFDDHEACNAKEDTKMLQELELRSEENYRKRLRQELIKKGKQRNLSRSTNPVTLCFSERVLECEYSSQKRDPSGAAILSTPIVLLVCSLAQFCILPRNLTTYLTFSLGIVTTSAMAAVCLSPTFSKSCPRIIVRIGENITGNFLQRHFWVSVVIIVLALTSFIDELSCKDERVAEWMNVANVTQMTDAINACLYPQFFTVFVTLLLLTVTVLLHINHVIKLVLMVSIVALQCCLNVTLLRLPFALSDQMLFTDDTLHLIGRRFTLSTMLVTVAISLACINRHTEITARLLFLWKKEVEEQKEVASSIRQKNEALVYNILPPHVATHFLGRRKRDEELYSQSYSEVGVLFASMPNFSDFYSEESVNNQGLECLRFLNEVISDFDALLEEPRFKDIIKIKTIGSTYMAASGLSGDLKCNASAPIKVRWAHLSRLAEFALALRDTLHGINEQSFNNFLLRMGINHGPIIAGVIGARKPHYDMWGNTVNVASRMESTGKAGCIQVVEETANILKEFGYEFEQRGLVSVKGKGRLMTHYLVGDKRET